MYIPYEVIMMISPATVHLLMKLLWYTDYIPCAVHYVPVTFSFHTWEFVPINHLHLFYLSPNLLLYDHHQIVFGTYESFCSVFFVHLFCFLDSTYMWNHKVFIFLCLINSLMIMLFRPIHVVANSKVSFFFFDVRYIYIYIYGYRYRYLHIYLYVYI